MPALNPSGVIQIGRPKDPQTGDLRSDERLQWIDDGSTAGASPGDVCIIFNGNIQIYQAAASTPV